MSSHGFKFEARQVRIGWLVVAVGEGTPAEILPSPYLTAPEARRLAATLNEAEAMREALGRLADMAVEACDDGTLANAPSDMLRHEADAARTILSRIEAAEKGSQ